MSPSYIGVSSPPWVGASLQPASRNPTFPANDWIQIEPADAHRSARRFGASPPVEPDDSGPRRSPGRSVLEKPHEAKAPSTRCFSPVTTSLLTTSTLPLSVRRHEKALAHGARGRSRPLLAGSGGTTHPGTHLRRSQPVGPDGQGRGAVAGRQARHLPEVQARGGQCPGPVGGRRQGRRALSPDRLGGAVVGKQGAVGSREGPPRARPRAGARHRRI
ncbi:hypothetical protein OR37_02915 [Caulobacter vibrioides OR37]|uniref:Uncharacterized protein n=1 Tax=Caulobacter vibrioides OR37 TaxID=1292034 RepID=R0CXM4_CAUVI|nr:hypothetical protein OR37_02915 [Caulobacter vibrioides OR37]